MACVAWGMWVVSVVLVHSASATSVGSEGFTVPPLSCFGDTATLRYDMTSVASDLSGVTWNPDTETFFAVNNGDRIAYEIVYPNTLIQSWDLTSYTLDLEGISSLGGRDFAIIDENPSKVITLTLEDDGTVSNATERMSGLPDAAASNLGFEGVAYLAAASKYIMVQEASPTKLWELPTDTYEVSNVTEALSENTQYSIMSVGGLTRGGDAVDEVFLVVKAYNGTGRMNASYIQKGIFRYNLTTGLFTERFGGEVCNMGQAEGLTFWKNATTGTIMMLIVGETIEARVYEADESCTDAMNDIDGSGMDTCEEAITTTSACEKTFEDGGCGWLRCDKALTTHTKICTDDEPGVSDCTEAQCMDHCSESNFDGDAEGETCTHWAYDEADLECYIFAGCVGEKWDEDYTLYAMEDPTCERTLEDYPLGCEQRRCDKTISTHNKICTDDVPDETDCTLEECQSYCSAHTEFTCSTYSYDVAGKECYLFETCEDEGFDEDYSTYVLQDPTCEKNYEAGGCGQRRCDKDLTPHDKICTDDTAEQQCTVDECEAFCSQYTFTDISSEAFCTHWAYDVVDMECYLFYGCIGEKYDDDYTLYTQSYGERLALQSEQTISTTVAMTTVAMSSSLPLATTTTSSDIMDETASFNFLATVSTLIVFSSGLQ